MTTSLFFLYHFKDGDIMDEKLIKKMIYMTIILFIFVLVSFVFAKKSTSDLKREQALLEQQLEEQENKYNRKHEYENNEEHQQNQTTTPNRDLSQYIDENSNNIEPTENNLNPRETSSNDTSTENKPAEQKAVEITKLTDTYLKQGYAIVKDFQINSSKFAIISKKSEYQSEYSKSTKKKYYIYKYIGQNLYETAYIMDVSIPKDKEGNEVDVFTVNVNGNTVEIKVNLLSNAVRQYSKQRLISTPISGANVLKAETITEQDSE